jgi:hypothetical protein
MKIRHAFLMAVLLSAFSLAALAQTPTTPTLLKRTTYKSDRLDFGAGGTLSVTGAPVGSIRIEGWRNPEIEVVAEIQLEASSEADIAKLSEVTTFLLEESTGRVEITSVGTHDKTLVKQLGKKFPKQLIGLPFRIDYVIKVPQYCDLVVNGGHGDLSVSGIDGTFLLNYLETNAKLDLRGGSVTAVFGKGTVDLTVPSPSWRGRFADVQLASGDMNVHLPTGMNAELDASILRSGKIENAYTGLKPRVRKEGFTDKSIVAKSGAGGIPLKFTVGDGTLKLITLGSLESRL